MIDIAIYTTPEVLEHKLELTVAWWELRNKPRRELVEWESRIYFATKGSIRGSFLITQTCNGYIEFDPHEWEPLEEPIPQRPFQGFKYLERND